MKGICQPQAYFLVVHNAIYLWLNKFASHLRLLAVNDSYRRLLQRLFIDTEFIFYLRLVAIKVRLKI